MSKKEYQKLALFLFIFIGLVTFSLLFGDRIRSWKEEKTESVSAPTETLSAKENFIQNVQPEVKKSLNDYDRIWNTYWKDTFSGISTKSMSESDAFQAMDDLITAYDLLINQIEIIPIPENFTSLEENQLLMFKQDLQTSCKKRQEAAKQTQEMFASSYYPASQTDLVQKTVESSDHYLLTSINAYVKLSEGFGESAKFD